MVCLETLRSAMLPLKICCDNADVLMDIFSVIWLLFLERGGWVSLPESLYTLLSILAYFYFYLALFVPEFLITDCNHRKFVRILPVFYRLYDSSSEMGSRVSSRNICESFMHMYVRPFHHLFTNVCFGTKGSGCYSGKCIRMLPSMCYIFVYLTPFSGIRILPFMLASFIGYLPSFVLKLVGNVIKGFAGCR